MQRETGSGSYCPAISGQGRGGQRLRVGVMGWAALLLAAGLACLAAPPVVRAQEPAAPPLGHAQEPPTPVTAEKAARHPWQPAPAPANARVSPQVCRIVNYADDMARTDAIGYPQTRWRYADIAYATAPPRKADPRPFVISQDADVNGNGRTDDDYVAALEFSMTEPLSTPEWPASPLLPERQNARFYGGEVWRVANAQPGERPFLAEIGINPDHPGPFFDDRADDHPIHGEADNRRPDSVHQHYVALLWKKEDFLNGGDRSPVTFNDSSRLAALVARYWYAFDDVRFIVQDGKDLYICEQGQDIPAKTFAGSTGRVFSIAPTKTRWAKYEPQGHRIAFDASKAQFEDHTFEDVQAIGWYLAKNNLGKGFSHTKWYTFEAIAVVNRAERPSEHLEMAPVPGSRPGGVEVPDFFLGACEVPYSLWKQVFRYGNSPTYTWDPTYVFDKDGDMGSMQLGNLPHEQDEPVTNLTLHDAAAFCNALSEMEGRTPCYYSDTEHQRVFRYEQFATRAKLPGQDMADLNTKNPICETEPPPKIFVRWDADGYRLPTPAEWESAMRIGKSQAEPAQAWVAANSEARTHPVGTLQADALKLHDLLGNVWEMTWDFGDVLDPAKQDTLLAMGGAIGYPADPATLSASPYGDEPYAGHATIGLRIVRRKVGLGVPAVGRSPRAPVELGASAVEPAGYSVNDGMPQWRVRRGEKTKAAAEAKPAAKPLLALAPIPAGTYKRQPDGATISITAMEAAKTPTTYAQWKEVRQWALARGYSFSHDGAMGSMVWFDRPHAPDEPVTGIAWHDAVVWCNALSEMEGRTPVYYDNEATTQVLRSAFRCRAIKIPGPELVSETHPFVNTLRAERREPWIFERWDVDGYRLPTSAEWDYLARGTSVEKFFWGATDKEKDACEWDVENAGGTSHPVGQKQPNGFGLFDIVGNVYTWCNGPSGASVLSREFADDTNNPKASRYWAYNTPEFKYQRCTPPLYAGGSWFWGTAAFEGDRGGPKYASPATATMPDVGLRVVRCKTGTHPRDGNRPMPETVLLQFDPKTFDPLVGAAWRGSLLRDGVFDVTGVAAAPKVRWRYDRTTASASSPVVAGGALYIGAADRFLALDATTGLEKWAVAVRGGVDSSACVAGGRVYFGGNDGRVHAVDAATGQEKWAVLVEGNTEHPILSSPAVAYGVVFVNAEGLAGLDAASGALTWRAKKRNAPAGLGSPTLFESLLIESGAGQTTVDFCDLRLGKSKSTAIQGYNCLSTSAVSNGVVYVANSGTGGFSYAGLTAVDIATRQKKWGIVIEEHLDPAKRTPVVASPTVWAGRVYVGSDGGRLYAFGATDGKPAWSLSLGGAVQSSAAVAAKSGLLYVGSRDGNLYAVDAKKGVEKWHFKTGGEVTASPWLAEKVVYMASQDGWVYALE